MTMTPASPGAAPQPPGSGTAKQASPPSAAAAHVVAAGQVKPGRSLKQRSLHTAAVEPSGATHSALAQSPAAVHDEPAAPGLGAGCRHRPSLQPSPAGQAPVVQAGAQNDSRGSSSAATHAMPAAQLSAYQQRSPAPAAPAAVRATTPVMKSAWTSTRVCRASWVHATSPDDATPTTCSPPPGSNSAGPPESPSHACDGAALEASRRASTASTWELPVRRAGARGSFATVQP